MGKGVFELGFKEWVGFLWVDTSWGSWVGWRIGMSKVGGWVCGFVINRVFVVGRVRLDCILERVEVRGSELGVVEGVGIESRFIFRRVWVYFLVGGFLFCIVIEILRFCFVLFFK